MRFPEPAFPAWQSLFQFSVGAHRQQSVHPEYFLDLSWYRQSVFAGDRHFLSRAWVVTMKSKHFILPIGVSMPSRAWVVTWSRCIAPPGCWCFNALSGLSCYDSKAMKFVDECSFQCPLGLELLRYNNFCNFWWVRFQCPIGLELLRQECPIF